jgi:hypothetical protein
MRLLIPFILVAALTFHGGAAYADDVPKVSVLSGEQVIRILDETVDWYRTLGTQQQYATQPSDLLILFANRETADQVVDLAFGIARANAELLSSEAAASEKASASSSQQTLDRQQEQLEARQKEITRQMDKARKQAAAGGKGRQAAEDKLKDLTGELEMDRFRRGK